MANTLEIINPVQENIFIEYFGFMLYVLHT
jgi:hypothetical protein